jgi:hypothetical protein
MLTLHRISLFEGKRFDGKEAGTQPSRIRFTRIAGGALTRPFGHTDASRKGPVGLLAMSRPER